MRSIMKCLGLLPLVLILAACSFNNNEIADNRQIVVTAPSANKFEFIKNCNTVDVSQDKVISYN